MKITFYGAARTVTGSKHLLEVNGTRILLDCGMVQGHRSDAYAANVKLPFDAAAIDLMVLSHAHIDHCGNIPNLVKNGFKGDIICTPATQALCTAMLLDSAHIQERDAEYMNKKRFKKGEPLIDAIYTREDALASFNAFLTQNYWRTRTIAPGVSLTFYDAGHMLGSASVALNIEDREKNREIHFVFSGDIGQPGIPIIRDPEIIERADVVIMESTYGDREHETYPDAEKHLERVIVEAVKRGGVIVVPAFAVGRTQQLVYSLHKLYDRGDIPHLPIYVDSPLAVDATSIFKLHPECYDDEIRKFMLQPGNINPFGFNDVTYISTLEDSKRLNFERQPCIIISASGMAEFGRIVHHLKNRIEDPKNTVLITGYQAENTLGRRIVEHAERVNIFGESYQLRAHVEVLDGFSGHADKHGLLNWVSSMKQQPKRTFLVHGEETAAMTFKMTLENKFANMKVDVPVMGQTFEV